MKIRHLVALCYLFGATAQAEEMDVYVWDPGCNHTTATNWFTVPASEGTQSILVDLSGCTEEQIGRLLFFGNYATKTSGRQLSSKHKVRLHLSALDSFGNVITQMTSDSGSILADVAHLNSPACLLVAENMNRKKDVKIRLRAQLIAP
ncbi:MAG: hypothetical protein OER80_10870 [Gammaproteobacteria bacterium]|nr:hypothetical protein [Gammaproteobacteria bacterium]